MPEFEKARESACNQKRLMESDRSKAIRICGIISADSAVTQRVQRFRGAILGLCPRPAAQRQELAGTHEEAQEGEKKGPGRQRGHSQLVEERQRMRDAGVRAGLRWTRGGRRRERFGWVWWQPYRARSGGWYDVRSLHLALTKHLVKNRRGLLLAELARSATASAQSFFESMRHQKIQIC